MKLCLFGPQGFISRGRVLQELEPRDHHGEAFSSLRPDLDDEILDFKLSLSGMKLGKPGREGIVYFTCVHLNCYGQKADYCRLYFPTCNSVSHSICLLCDVAALPTERSMFSPLETGQGLMIASMKRVRQKGCYVIFKARSLGNTGSSLRKPVIML